MVKRLFSESSTSMIQIYNDAEKYAVAATICVNNMNGIVYPVEILHFYETPHKNPRFMHGIFYPLNFKERVATSNTFMADTVSPLLLPFCK